MIYLCLISSTFISHKTDAISRSKFCYTKFYEFELPSYPITPAGLTLVPPAAMKRLFQTAYVSLHNRTDLGESPFEQRLKVLFPTYLCICAPSRTKFACGFYGLSYHCDELWRLDHRVRDCIIVRIMSVAYAPVSRHRTQATAAGSMAPLLD